MFACLALSALLAAPASAQVLNQAPIWTEQDAGTNADFDAVDCPSMDVCYAGSDAGGTMVKTTDGGDTWAVTGSGSKSISCLTELVCYAADGTTVSKTEDGGASWTGTGWGTGNTVEDIDCPTTEMCIVGTAVSSSNRTNVLIAQGSDVRTFAVARRQNSSAYGIRTVACPSTLYCYAAGSLSVWRTFGVPGSSIELGDEWLASLPDDQMGWSDALAVHDLACPTVLTCYGAGDSSVSVTRDGGNSWVWEPAPWAYSLYGIACTSPTTCVAGGDDGTITQTTTGAEWYPTRGYTMVDLDYDPAPQVRDVSCPVGLTCTAVGADGLILSQGRV